jgi:hypothetical protein
MEEPVIPEANTFVGFSVQFPQGSDLGGVSTRAAEDFNLVGDYEGRDLVSRLDLYMLAADGSILESRRFGFEELSWMYSTSGAVMAQPKEPFKTSAGEKMAMVVINSPLPLMVNGPSTDYTIPITNEMPLSAVGGFVTYTDGSRLFYGMASGKSTVTTITAGVTSDAVKAGANNIALSVDRLASRVIVTSSPNLVANSAAMGTFSNITYSVAQGSKSIYMLPKIEDGVYKTPTYDYLPDEDYIRTSAPLYCYDDLQVLTDEVPANPATTTDPQGYLNIEGKLLLENTHATYLHGNTAYVLVRTKFTPLASAIKDGGALASDGTFYVGHTDGNIYSSLTAATDPSIGVASQNVYTYTEGKVLYYAWLNPDDVENPTVSPVVRNNIYHININSFKSLGLNWNPLTPDINNPDPKPETPYEPESPIKPEDPLSSVDTYMSVDIEVKNWTVHSHDVDL